MFTNISFLCITQFFDTLAWKGEIHFARWFPISNVYHYLLNISIIDLKYSEWIDNDNVVSNFCTQCSIHQVRATNRKIVLSLQTELLLIRNICDPNFLKILYLNINMMINNSKWTSRPSKFRRQNISFYIKSSKFPLTLNR